MDTADFEIRPAHHDDVRAIARLWCDAFPGRRTVEDRIAALENGGRYGGLDVTLVARAGTRLAGACKLYRMTQFVAGRPLPMLGLAAVAVALPFRRQGLGARLCTRAIHEGAGRGDVISALFPFRPDYYERLGWGLVGGLRRHRFATASLPRDPESAAVRTIRSGVADDADAIAACYERVAAASTGPIRRGPAVWATLLAATETVVHDDGGVRGYAALRVRPARAGRPATVVIHELVAENEAARRGLLGHVAARADAWPRAVCYARPDERFEDRLRDPRPPGFRLARGLHFPTATVLRGPMARLLDVPAALAARRWFDADDPPPDGCTIDIETTDPERRENDGTWRVRIEPAGGATVGAADAAPPDARLRAGTSTLARLFFGEITPGEAARLGRASLAGDERLLERAFATRDAYWLLDEF